MSSPGHKKQLTTLRLDLYDLNSRCADTVSQPTETTVNYDTGLIIVFILDVT